MISLKLINDLKNEIMLPVPFMYEEATNDLSAVGHVFYYITHLESKLSTHSFLHFTGTS